MSVAIAYHMLTLENATASDYPRSLRNYPKAIAAIARDCVCSNMSRPTDKHRLSVFTSQSRATALLSRILCQSTSAKILAHCSKR